MERFKTFYKKHELGFSVATALGAGILVAVIHNHVVNGYTIKSADHFSRPDGSSVINAYLKNGQTICLIKPTV